MQIKAITVNAGNTTVGQNFQGNSTLVQVDNNMFTPQCKVTISKEGKRLSRQQTEQPKESAGDAAVQRKMLRRIEETEQNDKTMDGYREQLTEIEKKISSLNRSFKTEADRETIEKEQEILRDMREQKQAQLEEGQRYAKEARELAQMLRSAKYQEDVDGNNRKLWTFLKTLEEAEKAEEEREGGAIEDESGSDTSEAGNSVSDTIRNSATQFATASMGRDLYVQGKLEGLSDEGHRLLDIANAVTNNVLTEIENTRSALDSEDYTDDMKAEMMDKFQEKNMALSYDDVEKSRSHGLHILREVRDHKIKRIADDPLAGLQETKDSIMMSAADAVLGEARQSHLDETSKELADEVQKLIDERNDVDRTQEEKEEEEKAEDLKELTDTETEEEKDGQREY
ncbi:MAG: hypothetical protein J1E64_11795 [Acetatifactor sp.]|nr:hypothetical protein [Acetatifactor sp.]